MRSIKEIHKASFAPIADLITYSSLPSNTIDQIDPFLFLNHHGLQVYPPHNNGLPFGPHPHRGMETVTFIVEGDIMHEDSGGHESIIEAGGVQWMTAGRGLIHAEVSSEKFKREGGRLEILQLWVNLPARLKMSEPKYLGFQKDMIPVERSSDGKVTVRVISGVWGSIKGAFESSTNVSISTMEFLQGGNLTVRVPENENILFYVIRGSLTVNQVQVKLHDLVEFSHDHELLNITANEDSILLYGHAQPFNEPVVAQGPFVMNTQQEIFQAYDDYRKGRFGVWSK